MEDYINKLNILSVFNKLNYTYNNTLDIVAIRRTNQNAGKFDDILYVSYIKNNDTITHYFKCTTDPSDLYLKNPMSKLGCAILKPGQWKDSWTIGKHKDHIALVQLKKITVIRDYNKNGILDYNTPTDYSYIKDDNSGFNHIRKWYKNNNVVHIEETGVFGLDVHRASAFRSIDSIGLYSAGCIVIQNPSDFKVFMEIMHSFKEVFNNRFTLTLITEEQLRSNIKSIPLNRSGSIGVAAPNNNNNSLNYKKNDKFMDSIT